MLPYQLKTLAQASLSFLLISLHACTFIAPFSECNIDSDCGDHGVCIDGGICLSFELELEPCIGDEVSGSVPESCRAQLENLRFFSSEDIGGCFIVQTEGYKPRGSRFAWREGVVHIMSLGADYQTGAQFNTHLYFISRTTTEEINCDSYLETLGLDCGSIPGCVLKLTSEPQRFDSTRLSISYGHQEREGCNLSLNQNLIGVETLLDKVDNDCDGKIDESGQLCTIGEGLCESQGVWRTSATGSMICDAETYLPGQELCANGLDEDCDGRIDEGFQMMNSPCQLSREGLTEPGVFQCSFDLTQLECVPGLDVCNGLDDDEDGLTDEGHELTVVTCPVGSCGDSGYLLCQDGVSVSSCQSAATVDQGFDDCDGFDSDCDGAVDEDALIRATNCGSGACEQSGQIDCVMGREVSNCTPSRPQEELCDERDNDCDGEIDEELEGCGVPCEGGRSEELACDQIDNDCDGRVDEVAPPPEVCDPVDNDCDGRIDEGLLTCPTSTLESCMTTLFWTDGEGQGTASMPIYLPRLSPLAPSWDLNLNPSQAPFLPAEGDRLSLEMNCLSDEGWGEWINAHCGVSLSFSERTRDSEYRSEELNPRTCIDQGENDISGSRCISTHVDRVIELEDNFDRYGLRFACPLTAGSSAHDQMLAAHLEAMIHYQLKVDTPPLMDNDCTRPLMSCTSCRGFQSGSTFYVENLKDCDALYFGVELSSP